MAFAHRSTGSSAMAAVPSTSSMPLAMAPFTSCYCPRLAVPAGNSKRQFRFICRALTQRQGRDSVARVSSGRRAGGSIEPGREDEPSCSGKARHLEGSNWSVLGVTSIAAGSLLVSLLVPHAASAGESLPLEFVRSWLEEIEALGPLGGSLFVATVIVAEMIPLFPTQPLMLAGGLLFGAVDGGILVCLGTLCAALASFALARTIGHGFAQRVIDNEMGEDEGNSGLVQAGLKRVYSAIEGGDFWQQYVAVVLLRMTPVVPFSASNYLLGLTPLPYLPFAMGSVSGMAMWSLLYSSIGSASRAVLDRGANIDELFADMSQKAGSYTSEIASVVLVGGAAVSLAYWAGALPLGGNAAGKAGSGSDGSSSSSSSSNGGGKEAQKDVKELVEERT